MSSEPSVSLSSDGLLLKMFNEKITRLNQLKIASADLHKKTEYPVNREMATTILKQVIVNYGQKNHEATKDALSDDQQFLLALAEFLEKLVAKDPDVTPTRITLYAKVKQTASELKKIDYNFYLDYIFRSTTASSVLMSKSFTAANDLVEPRLILTDSYSKDTLTNEVRTLYTKGGNGFGLSFSKGFFYTEMLGDKPYYFKIVDPTTGSKQIIEDKRIVSDVSIGGMAHGYWKVSPEVRLGPSIGLAISFALCV